MRKLVTKRLVSKLIPIENADRIELAVIDGWSCIVKKGEFKVGDEGIYFEIDSFLPVTDTRFSFLGESKIRTHQGRRGWRIRTMKMRGVISQGLLLPVSMFKDLNYGADEFSDQLHVIKYDVAETKQLTDGNNQKAARFPEFLRKTDQERLQNCMHYFGIYADHVFEETLKLDGSSCTMYSKLKPKNWWQKLLGAFGLDAYTTSFGVCSRNLEISKDNGSNFWYVAHKYNIPELLPTGYSIQGELVGPSIQGNHEKVSDYEFYVFDVFDIDAQHYLLPAERAAFMHQFMPKVPHAPILNSGVKIFKDCPDLETLQKRVTSQGMNKGVISEGRVYKSTTIPNLSFKLISNDYLLKCEG